MMIKSTRRIAIYILFILLLLNVHSQLLFSVNLSINSDEYKKIQVKQIGEMLKERKLNGAVLIFDPSELIFYSNDFDWVSKVKSPASTFKIPNSIIALELGVVEDEETVFKWDGNPRRLKVWEKDLTFHQAFKMSCVPCYQEIARAVGVENMKYYLDKFSYPGMFVDSSNIDTFWLEGESGISQIQQIHFLTKFYFNEFDISPKTYNIMKNIMLAEKEDTYVLYGKTGWGIRKSQNNGWYVGFVETEDNLYFFATNVEPNEEFEMSNFNKARIEITKHSLRIIGLIK